MAFMHIHITKGCGNSETAPFSCKDRKYYLLFVLFLSFMVSFASPGYSEPEVRGLWVVRNNIVRPDSIRKLVEFADSNDFNVLFVQIRGRGDAYYKSHFAPSPEGHLIIPDSFDPLAMIIELAHARGIEVHAWFNMYFTWSPPDPPNDPRHPLNRHPEWFMVSKTGLNMGTSPIEYITGSSVEGRYLSPCLESVRLYLTRIISEVIINYDVDGVHLDYIRYPSRDYDFHTVMREKFTKRYGIDPLEVVNGDQNIDPELKFLKTWVDFRVSHIDKNVKDISQRIKLLNKSILLSAAVKPHADEAYYEFGQNWAGWLNDGIVDFVVAMSYFDENETFINVLDTSLKKVDRRKVIGGIGIYKIKPEIASEQIAIVRKMGLLGYCLFSYKVFVENPEYSSGFEFSLPLGGRELPPEFKPYLRSTR